MGETDKPFACKIEGCQMTFTNEDHLNVHRKKHDMVLNLGLTYKTSVTADQTPTPTRFIRNCEEVGLFQDLQNVNPFEETFKKAIEHSKTGILHIPDSLNDDSLHTPQIFQHISEHNDNLQQPSVENFNEPTEIDDDILKIDSQNSSRDECLSPVDNLIKENSFSYSNEISTSIEQEYDQGSSTSDDTIVEDLSIVKKNLNGYLLKSNKHDTKSNVKEKIKEVLHNKRKQDVKPLDLKIKDNDLTITTVKRPRPRINLKSKLKEIQSFESNSNKIDKQQNLNFYDNNLNEVEKRRAMNRMAQMRSRKRKKLWLDQMEQEIDKLKGDNKLLVTENQKLKEENILLKSMLLKHNNCQLPDYKVQNSEGSTKILNDKLDAVQTKATSFTAYTSEPLQNHIQVSPAVSSINLTNGSIFPQKLLPKLLPKTDIPCRQLSNDHFSDISPHSSQFAQKFLPKLLPKPDILCSSDQFSDVSSHNDTILNLTSTKIPQTIVFQVKTIKSEIQ